MSLLLWFISVWSLAFFQSAPQAVVHAVFFLVSRLFFLPGGDQGGFSESGRSGNQGQTLAVLQAIFQLLQQPVARHQSYPGRWNK